MSRFTDRYLEMNKNRVNKSQAALDICENPILAFMQGIPESEITTALRGDGWPEAEIAKLFEAARKAKQSLQ